MKNGAPVLFLSSRWIGIRNSYLGAGVPRIKKSSRTKTGNKNIKDEIPNSCAGQMCSFGINLTTDGNALVAKGVDLMWSIIESLQYNNSAYNTLSGTSMATPHVAGLLAMIQSYNPDYRYQDVIQSVLNGGDTSAALLGQTVTGKAINAFGSLTYVAKPMGVSGTVVIE